MFKNEVHHVVIYQLALELACVHEHDDGELDFNIYAKRRNKD